MTRKDYELIAGTFKAMVRGLNEMKTYSNNAEHSLAVMRELTNNLSDKLEIDNPRFDRHKFWTAVGL
jgi:hypothetical protein